jgi:hypothetical protein
MFLPSFFTGMLIQKFGVYRIIISGLAILFLYIIIALMGTGFAHFVSALFIVGLGWNFLFIGGSSLLTKVYRPEEKEKTGFPRFHGFCSNQYCELLCRQPVQLLGLEWRKHCTDTDAYHHIDSGYQDCNEPKEKR